MFSLPRKTELCSTVDILTESYNREIHHIHEVGEKSDFSKHKANFTEQDGEQLQRHWIRLWHLFHRIMPHTSVERKYTQFSESFD